MSYIQQQQQQQSTGINRPLNFAATNNRHVQQQRATTTKQLSNQGSNLNRSCSQLSGSDTDVSTSNENLSNEERYVIKHTARQEPQGQENQQHSPSRSSSHCKESSIPNIQQQQQQGNSNSSTSSLLNRNSLKDDASNCSNRNSFRQSSLSAGSNRNSLKDSINGNSNRNSLKDNLSSSNRTSIGSNRSSLDVSTSSYNTLIIHNQANEDNLWAPSSAVASAAALPSSSSSRLSGVIKEHGDMGAAYHVYENDTEIGRDHSNFALDDHSFYSNTINSGCQEITDIPDDYLNQSQVLKHLAKEVRVPSYNKLAGDDQQCTEISEGGDGSNSNRISEGDSLRQNEFDSSLPSNCYRRRQLYTTTATTALPISLTSKQDFIGQTEKLAFSRSQPDLSRISKLTLTDGGMDNYDFQQTTSPRPQTKGREEFETWPTSEMVQILIQENSALKLELDRCYKKVAKSQQLEKEIAKVHRAHEELVASSERREKLERAARSRLQSDCRRLTELNRALRDQIELLSTRAESSHSIDALRKELSQKELFIGQLITQTKELAAAKERQEIELAAQRATLQEQRTHIDILDTALTNAQSNVVRLEEECRKNKVYVERVGQLQRALSSLQASSDRREETERQLRDQLERELREGAAAAAAAVAAGTSLSAAREGSSLATANGETVHELKRKLRERNEKIMSLEGDVAKWEQRYLEESALRQAAIDAASLPKDAKIAALEKTSQDAEKLLAEAHSEKLRQMDQVHAAQKKLADLESRMKDLESKLAERDAMIRVLQKHTYDKAAAAAADSSSGGYQAMHSSHSSTSAVDHHHHHHHHHTALTSAPELVSSVLGGGSGYSSSSTASYGVGSAADAYKYGSTSSSSSSRKQASFEQTNKSLDDQLKELDSQLLSKRALCCFPGFSNPGAPSRKGKIPKPLLASVDRLAGSSSSGGKSRLLNAAEGLARDEPEAASMLSASNAILDLAVAASRFKSRFSDEVCSGVGGKPAEDMMLLEKQGRSSQRQRMSSSQEPNQQQQHQQHQQQQLENRRAGSLPPSSLPRPPRAFGAGKNAAGRYCRLSDSEQTARKKPPAEAAEVYRFESPSPSHAAKLSLLRRKQSSENVLLSDAEDYHQRQHHKQPYRDSAGNCKKSVGQYERLGGAVSTTSGHPRSLIPPPPASSNSSSRRYGAIHPEYGRLSDSAAAEPKSSPLQLQQPIRGQSTGSIVSIKSCDTSSAMLKSSNRSIPRPSNYKIQF